MSPNTIFESFELHANLWYQVGALKDRILSEINIQAVDFIIHVSHVYNTTFCALYH